MTNSTTLFIGLFATIQCLASLSASFSPPTTQLLSSSLPKTTYTQLNLVPLSEVWDHSSSCNENQISFADLVRLLDCKSFDSDGHLITSSTKTDDTNKYRLYLATHVDDLPPIAQLTLDVFDASAITISTTNDWSEIEKIVVGAVVQPTVGLYNSYAAAVGYTEVLSGLRKRMRNRVAFDDDSSETIVDDNYDWLTPLVVPESSSSSSPDIVQTSVEAIAAQSSLILVLARKTDKGEMQSAASVELRLQPTDAKIPFSQPWLDKIERRLAQFFPFDDTVPVTTNKMANPPGAKIEVTNKSKSAPLRPYLCNLCVSPSLRSMGIGRSLCRIVEAISHRKWEYSNLYLHVDPDNKAALSLYEKEGYVDVGRRWNAKWNAGANQIGYYTKKLKLKQ